MNTTDEKARLWANVLALLDKLPEDEQRRILLKYVGGEGNV
jgi:hypothetical protein